MARHDCGDHRATAPTSRSAIIIALRIIAVCAGIATLNFASPVLIPIVLSGLLFYALDPIVDRVEAARVPRLLASTGVVTVLIGVIALGATYLRPQVEAIVSEVPQGAAKLRAAFRDGKSSDSIIDKLRHASEALDSAAAEAAPTPVSKPGVVRVEVQQPLRVSDWLWTQGLGIVSVAGQAITVLFLTIFLLNEDDSFKRKLVRQMETLGSKRLTVQILNDIAAQMKRFIWVQVFTSALVAVVTAAMLWWFGLRQWAVWGLLAGLLNIVPYFGPLIVSTIITIVAFLQFGAIGQAALIGFIALVITTVEGMFLTPHLLSKTASLNPVGIFLAIAFFSWAWGVAGTLLAVPLLMTIKSVCDQIEGLQSIGEFLGEEPAPTTSAERDGAASRNVEIRT